MPFNNDPIPVTILSGSLGAGKTTTLNHILGSERELNAAVVVNDMGEVNVDADLLALDEPTVGVDAESREEFYSLLHDLNATGLTVILIEHDIGVVTTYATDIACVNRQLYFDGTPDEFVETDALAQAYGTDQNVLHHDH
jgi:zinc transport system ATP-binding protein